LPAPFPFRDASFGGVLAIGVLMHLEQRDLKATLKEVARIIIPGGIFFLSVIASRDDLNNNGRDAGGRWYNLLDSSAWIAFLNNAGFLLRKSAFDIDGLGRSGVSWHSFCSEKSSS